MSITSIEWQPVNKGIVLQVGGLSRQSLVTNLERAFGKLPVRLGRDHVDMLLGMAATVTNQNGQNPYEQLVSAILEHDLIEIRYW